MIRNTELEEATEAGIEKGSQENALEIAKNLLNAKMDLDSIVLENFVLNEELLRLGKYLKQITLCSLISAYNTMLPSSLKTSKNHDYSKYQTYIILDKDISLVREYLKTLKYPKQREILEKLLENNEVLKTKNNTSTVKTLISKGLVK